MYNPYRKAYDRNQRITMAVLMLASAVAGVAAAFTAVDVLFSPLRVWYHPLLALLLFGCAILCWIGTVASLDVLREIEGHE